MKDIDSQNNLEKQEQSWRVNTTGFQVLITKLQ